MKLHTFDFESSLKTIGDFVQAVISDQDENKKNKMVEELQHFLELAKSPNSSRKRCKNCNSNIPQKKIKLESRVVEMPNEIWTKIMNYLPTKEIFQNFGLVSKRFQSLIGGIKYLQVRNIDNLDKCTKVIEIVKNSKTIVALDLNMIFFTLKLKNVSNFVMQTINSCPRLKSFKIGGHFYVNLDLIKIFQKIEHSLEHLTFDKIQTTPEVLIEVSKLKSLKSLRLSNLNLFPNQFSGRGKIVDSFKIVNSQVINALTNNSKKLESIDLVYNSSSTSVDNALNQFLGEKKNSLKKVKLMNRVGPKMIYQNLKLCQNLEVLSGNLHLHGFQDIKLKLKKLSAGHIFDLNDLVIFSQMNLQNLEHLQIEIEEELFGEFAHLQFSSLKYLVLTLNHHPGTKFTSLSNGTVQTLLKHSPNLKSLLFRRTNVNFGQNFLVKIFKKHGTIISNMLPNPQEDREIANYFYKNNIDYSTFLKYQALKTTYQRQFQNHILY